jgi:hypothetical protein
MTPDPILELSVEQLVRALNNKLFMECTRVQSAISPASPALVATLAAEVRSEELKPNPRVLTRPFTGRRSGETSQRHSTRGDFLEELPTACEPSPSRGHRAVRHLHLRYRSPTNHLLDPRLPILAQSNHFQPQELGIDRQWVETISPIVSRTCWGGPPRS